MRSFAPNIHRLDYSGTQALSGGIGNMFRALQMAPLYQAQAAEEARNAEMKRSLMGAQTRMYDARTALFGQESEEKRQQLDRGGLGEMIKTAYLMNGGRLDQAAEASDFFQSGALPSPAAAYEPTPDGVGPTLPKPAYADPSFGEKLYRTLGLNRQALTVGEKNVENIAKAAGAYQQQDAIRSLTDDPSQAARVGQAYAAVGGKPLVQNIGNTGEGFNVFSGEGVTIDPGLRTLFGEQGAALVRQRKAAAGASDANAGLSTARRDRVVGGFDKPVTVVDEDTGDAQITRLPTAGQPVTIGVAPKKATGKDATLQKERNKVVSAMEKDILWQDKPEAEFNAEVERRMARRSEAGARPAPAADTPAGDAPRDPKQRKAGTVYSTPKGPMKWTGTGWLPAN